MEVGESSSPSSSSSTPGREVTSLHPDSSSSLWEPRCPVSHLFIRGRKVGQVRAHLVGLYHTVLRIRICMFLGLLYPDPLVRGTDPDPSIVKQKKQEKP